MNERDKMRKLVFYNTLLILVALSVAGLISFHYLSFSFGNFSRLVDDKDLLLVHTIGDIQYKMTYLQREENMEKLKLVLYSLQNRAGLLK